MDKLPKLLRRWLGGVEYVTVDLAMERTGLSRRRVYQLREEGVLPTMIRAGRAWMKWEDVCEWARVNYLTDLQREESSGEQTEARREQATGQGNPQARGTSSADRAG